MFWVLIVVVLTTDGSFIPYEQGTFQSWDECHNMKKLVLEELGQMYRGTCLEWKNVR